MAITTNFISFFPIFYNLIFWFWLVKYITSKSIFFCEINLSNKSGKKTDFAKMSLNQHSVELKNLRDAPVSSIKIIEQK